MARIKYYYDTESCRYERIKVSTWDIVLNLGGFIALVFIAAFGLYYIFDNNFPSAKETQLVKENQELKAHNAIYANEVQALTEVVTSLEEKDDNVYRAVLGAEPLPDKVRNGGIGGVNRFKEIMDSDYEQEELILKNYKKVYELKKKIIIQDDSYKELLAMVQKKEDRFASLPAIQPISNKSLKRLSSGYGMRKDPIHGTRRMHKGLDFSAPKGTPIYATANGAVRFAKFSPGGYGYHVVLDHGYGYETLYGHMNQFIVKTGQKVKRGEIIGYVGNTGKSTAPHLHYEVRKNRKQINPVHFFSQELSPTEYEEILRLASIETSALGSTD